MSGQAWVRLTSPEGQAELRLSDGAWQVLVRRIASEAFSLAATGGMDGASDPVLPGPDDAIAVGDLTINPATREVTQLDKSVVLTPKEFDLLRVLSAEPTRVFTKAELSQAIWGRSPELRTRTLDSHASRLRQKLGGRYVCNSWGVGYSLTRP